MRASIIKTVVDTNKLNEMIGIYENNFTDHPYLIMSKETADRLINTFLYDQAFSRKSDENKSHGYVGLYEGCKMFYDNDLAYGDIEIR